MSEGQVYDIPAARLEWFKAQMSKLETKAKRLGIEGQLFLTVMGFHKEEDAQSRWHGQRIMEVFVACPEPRLNGWEFVARIDHANEVGNVLRSTGLLEVPEIYRDAPSNCDHCSTYRRRRDTFVVHHADHGFKQVGSSCLRDFLGHGDADRLAKLAELLSNVRGYAQGSYHGDLADLRYVDTEMFMACAAQAILDHGFISRRASKETGRDATAEVANRLYAKSGAVSNEARQLADAALTWAQNLDQGAMDDYQHNCWVVANAAGLEPRTLGIAASIVGVYWRAQQPKASPTNHHVGVVGEKLEIELMVDHTRILDTGTVLHNMRDRQGNVLKWFSSGKTLPGQRGHFIKVRATVKAHDAYKGQAQTLLTRCQVV